MWAGDTYGAAHPIARKLTGKLISLLRDAFPGKSKELVQNEVWSALSAALVARAAAQLCRHMDDEVLGGDAASDSNGEDDSDRESMNNVSHDVGEDVVDEDAEKDVVDEDTTEDVVDEDVAEEVVVEDVKTAGKAEENHEPAIGVLGIVAGEPDPISACGSSSLGIRPDQQPHPATEVVGVPAGDSHPEAAVAAPAASLEQAATAMDAEAEPPPPLHLLIRLPSGRLMPVNAPSTASVADLKAAVLTRCAWPAEAMPRAGLALADMALAEARSLAGNGVEDGDTLVVFERHQ